MKSLKRLISICLSAVCSVSIAASMFPLCGSAQENYGNLTYMIRNNGTISITGCADDAESIVIPESIGGKAVTAIPAYAFSNKIKLKYITIPKSITEIGSKAFYNTPWLGLKARDNPLVTVNSILVDAAKCKGDIVIPSDITSISQYAFSQNSQITSVVIPETITKIENGTFSGCSALKSVTFPSSIQSIGSTAFYKCKGLTEITIPKSVSAIENNAFFGCSELKRVTIENPNCSLDGDNVFTTIGLDEGKPEPFIGTIYGNDNSTAHEYADKNNCKFLAVNEYGVIGDANGDGNISPIDVSIIFTEYKKLYRNEKGSFTDNQIKLCDLNGNEKINASDASAVFSIYKENYRRAH